MLNNLQQTHWKLLQKEQFKNSRSNNIADKITGASQILPQNNSETITNKIENIKHEKEIPTESYISPNKEGKLSIP